jgi:hypothetical protein
MNQFYFSLLEENEQSDILFDEGVILVREKKQIEVFCFTSWQGFMWGSVTSNTGPTRLK